MFCKICLLHNYEVPYSVAEIGEDGIINLMIDSVEQGKAIGFPDVI